MNTEHYIEIANEFDAVLHICKEISAKLVGTFQHEVHLSYADSIYTKLLCHAISLQKLSPRLENKLENEVWDLPSACAIARCIIEAHDVLGYIVFSKISPEEREFRILVWHLHDQQRRSKILHAIESKDKKAEDIHKQAQILGDEVTAHAFFVKIPKYLQNKIKGGDAPAFLLSQRELNQANGINQQYHTSSTMWLSQHVHTFAMSLHQLNAYQAGSAEALRLSSLPLQYSLGYLAEAAMKMAQTFQEANIAVEPKDKSLLLRWSFLVRNGLTALDDRT